MTRDNESTVGSSPWLLRGKLRPPIRHLSLIDRPALLEFFDDLLNYQASIVVAPAGYGKTSILAQWRERQIQRQNHVGWLTIDGQDNDPYRFLCYAIFALSDAGVELGQLSSLAEQGLAELTSNSVLVSLLSSIEAHHGLVVLIIDDYHRVEADGVDQLLDKLIKHAPSNFHIIISSRNRPNLGVARLCITGRGIEVDAKKLQFSEQEINQALGDVTNPELLDAVKSSTEGWPVAVQLARLAVRSGKDISTVFGVTGRDSHIADFLSEQVVGELPDDVQTFLTRTAIVDQMNPELANAVYGGQDAWRYIRELDHLSVLIVALDDEGDWYRYHHLFANFLLARLKERESEHIAELHQRASDWFAAEGDTYRAVRHAVLGENMQRAASLVEAAGGWELILFGGIGYLRNLLNLIPNKQLVSFPRLEIAKAYLLTKMGDLPAARAHYDNAIAKYDRTKNAIDREPEFQRDMVNIGTILSVYEDKSGISRDWTSSDTQRLPTGEPDNVTHGVLQCYRATQQIYNGRFDSARVTLRLAMQSMRQANSVLGLNYCYIHAALNNYHSCNTSQAFANAREASNMAADNFGNDSGLKSLSDIVLTALLFWTNRKSEINWERFESAVKHSVEYDGWFEVYALALEAQVERHLLRRDFKLAQEAITIGKKVAKERAIERLDWHAQSMQVLLDCEATDQVSKATEVRALQQRFPLGWWRENRYEWRIHVYASLALASHFSGKDDEKSEACAKDAIECCRHLNANFALLRSLCTYAAILDRANRRQHALDILEEAIALAEPQGLSVAVARTPSLVPLLRHAQGKWRAEALETAIIRFVGTVLDIIQEAARGNIATSDGVALSRREREVILELSLGGSNKEIARALDMTEHTVKFHLKNIFRKLSVSRRTEALKVARDQGLISA